MPTENAAPTATSVDHGAALYDSDGALGGLAAAHLGPALRAGRPAVAIAPGDRLEAIRAGLAATGIGPRSAALTCVEATRLLDGPTGEDGLPDWEGLTSALTAILDGLPRGGEPVACYSEILALLWRQRGAPAVDLEDRWDEFATAHDLDLVCGYPIQELSPAEETALLDAVAARHARIVETGALHRLHAGGTRVEQPGGPSERDRAERERTRQLLDRLREANEGLAEKLRDAHSRIRELREDKRELRRQLREARGGRTD